jgi:hypothetical protein
MLRGFALFASAAGAAVLLACAHAQAGSGQIPAQPLTPAAITEIAIERRCFGCPNEQQLVFSRGGTATKVTFGNARRGTSDRRATAPVTPEQFDRLARAGLDAGFFSLDAEYRDPQVADGAWTMTTVTAGARTKSILDRDGRAPAALVRFQSEVDAVANVLIWKE